MRCAAVEPQRSARAHRHRFPPELLDDPRRDAAALVGFEELAVRAAHDLQAAVAFVGVVDRDERRHVQIDHRVRGRVLVG